jgi:hypothetical protein
MYNKLSIQIMKIIFLHRQKHVTRNSFQFDYINKFMKKRCNNFNQLLTLYAEINSYLI